MLYIPSMKDATKGMKIEPVPDPDLLLIPLSGNAGSEPEPLVSPGDRVRRYQLIAASTNEHPDNIHSPVSGIVEKVEDHLHLDGSYGTTIFIRNDKMATETDDALKDLPVELPDQLLEVIRQAGIVGLGGAQFPTAVKYDRKGKPVDTFIINGAECEPYLTGDYALMSQRTEELLEGILLADKILDARDIVIAFENADRELDDIFAPFLTLEKYGKIRTRIVPDEYPQGGELQLAKTVTGIEIPRGTIPLDKGIIISNVGTLLAVYDAVVLKKPVVERVITVSGEKAARAGIYRVMIGTPLEHFFTHDKPDPADTIVVAGGPMMSPRVLDLSVPVHKGTLGIVALPAVQAERQNCIWCGYCADVCPMKLMPMQYERFYRQGKYTKMEDYDLDACIECSACEYICPSRVPLIESIKRGKAKLKTMKEDVAR